jgi:hypothetical protein
MCRFARGYADHTEHDHQALLAAVAQGVLHTEAANDRLTYHPNHSPDYEIAGKRLSWPLSAPTTTARPLPASTTTPVGPISCHNPRHGRSRSTSRGPAQDDPGSELYLATLLRWIAAGVGLAPTVVCRSYARSATSVETITESHVGKLPLIFLLVDNDPSRTARLSCRRSTLKFDAAGARG